MDSQRPTKRPKTSNSTSSSPSIVQPGSSSSSTAAASNSSLPNAGEDYLEKLRKKISKKLGDPATRTNLNIILNQLGTSNDPTSEEEYKKDPARVGKLRAQIKKLLIRLVAPALRSGSLHSSGRNVTHFDPSPRGYWYSSAVWNQIFANDVEFAEKVPQLMGALWERVKRCEKGVKTAVDLKKATSSNELKTDFTWLVKCCNRDIIETSVVDSFAADNFSIPGSRFGFEHDFHKLFTETDFKDSVREWRAEAGSVFDFVASLQTLHLYVPKDGLDLLEVIKDSKVPFFKNKKSAEALAATLNYPDQFDPSGLSFTQALLNDLIENYAPPTTLTEPMSSYQKTIALRSLRRARDRSTINLAFADVARHERDLAKLAGLEHERNVLEAARPIPELPETKYSDKLKDLAKLLTNPLQEHLAKLRSIMNVNIEQALQEYKAAADYLLGTNSSETEQSRLSQEILELSNESDYSENEIKNADSLPTKKFGVEKLANIGPFNIYAGPAQYEKGYAHERLRESVTKWKERYQESGPPMIPKLVDDYPTSIAKLVPDILKELDVVLSNPYIVQVIAGSHEHVFSEIKEHHFFLPEGIAHLTRSKARIWLHRETLGDLLHSLVQILSEGVVLSLLLQTAGFADLITENRIRLLLSEDKVKNAQRAVAHAVKMDAKGMSLNFDVFTTAEMPESTNAQEILAGLRADPLWRMLSIDAQDERCDLESLCDRLVNFSLTQHVSERDEFSSVYVLESRKPIQLWDGLSLQGYFLCPAALYCEKVFSPGLATSLLRIHKSGHLGCKMARGKVYNTIGAPKNALRVNEIGSGKVGAAKTKVGEGEAEEVDDEIKAEEVGDEVKAEETDGSDEGEVDSDG